MQTNFTELQLADPDTASSNQILRTCVHCGMCTATCPTFLLQGDELDSPRGRIYLMKNMLEGGQPATEEVVRHVDRCLSCLACMTTCPSGVNYMHLVDHARRYIEDTYERPPADRALRWVLAKVLPDTGLFRLSMVAARLARPLAGLVPGTSQVSQRLRAMLRLAPARLPASGKMQRPQVHRAQGERRARVALLTGCAQKTLAPSINEATIRLLTRMGADVVIAPEVGCCGALTHHLGRHDDAMAAARAAIEGWSVEIETGGLDAIVVNTSGCGTTVKDYGFMFRNEPEPWRSRAAEVSLRTKDISEILSEFGYAPTRAASGLRVAYHSACSLQHGQRCDRRAEGAAAPRGFQSGGAGRAAYLLRFGRHLQHHAAGNCRPSARAQAGQYRAHETGSGGGGEYRLHHAIAGRRGTAGAYRGVAGLDGGRTEAGGFGPAGRRMRRQAVLAGALLLAAAAPSPDRAAPLLDALAHAPSEQQAEMLEQQIGATWRAAVSPAVQLLADRAMQSLGQQDPRTAIGDLDAALDLQPDSALLWRLHAEARFANGDSRGAYADLAQALSREPRCFPALADLSRMAESKNDGKRALQAWQRYLQIDPHAPRGEARLQILQRKVSGDAL